jgi:hypothetical protein
MKKNKLSLSNFIGKLDEKNKLNSNSKDKIVGGTSSGCGVCKAIDDKNHQPSCAKATQGGPSHSNL